MSLLYFSGAILSYAIETDTTDPHKKTENYNHFVIFDPKNVLACRGFEFIDIIPGKRTQGA